MTDKDENTRPSQQSHLDDAFFSVETIPLLHPPVAEFQLRTRPSLRDGAELAASSTEQQQQDPCGRPAAALTAPESANAQVDPTDPSNASRIVLKAGADRYRFREIVHRSAMCVIWRSVDEEKNVPVAIKVVPRRLAPRLDAAASAALIETSAASGLVQVIGNFRNEGWWYQVLEWLDGEPLHEVIDAHPETPIPTLERWLRQLCGAIEALHAAGFVHGDVKPENVLIQDGQAYLIDLACLQQGDSWSQHAGLTPAYASPDAHAGGAANPGDDVYGLAATIYRVLTRSRATSDKSFDLAIPALPPLTESQAQILRAAMAPISAQRTQSVSALREAFWPEAQATPDIPEQTPASAPLTPPVFLADVRARGARRRRHGLALRTKVGAAAAFALVAMLAVSMIPLSDDPPAPRFAGPGADAVDENQESSISPLAAVAAADPIPAPAPAPIAIVDWIDDLVLAATGVSQPSLELKGTNPRRGDASLTVVAETVAERDSVTDEIAEPAEPGTAPPGAPGSAGDTAIPEALAAVETTDTPDEALPAGPSLPANRERLSSAEIRAVRARINRESAAEPASATAEPAALIQRTASIELSPPESVIAGGRAPESETPSGGRDAIVEFDAMAALVPIALSSYASASQLVDQRDDPVQLDDAFFEAADEKVTDEGTNSARVTAAASPSADSTDVRSPESPAVDAPATDIASQPEVVTVAAEVSVKPDTPAVRPDTPNGRPDFAAAKPDMPNGRPDVAPGRPDVPNGRPDFAAAKPDIPNGRPDVAPGRPDIPNGRPELAAARPDIPTGRPDVAPGRPDIPTGRPDVAPGRPDIPTGRPDVPRGRPDIPTGRPDVAPGRPDIPTGRPDIPRGRPDIPGKMPGIG